MIAVIDYGIGNLGSIVNAIKHLGYDCVVTNDHETIINADKVILPGVGAFADAVNTFKSYNLDKTLDELIKLNKPILGICVGMQMLFEYSTEFGHHEGLKILKGGFKKFDSTLAKVPHMGWNNIILAKEDKLTSNLDNKFVYFVHSYYLENTTEEDILTYTYYAGVKYVSSIKHNNIYATQFHPEKSGKVGLEILKRFINL